MEFEHVEKQKSSIFKKLERHLSINTRSKSSSSSTTAARNICTKSRSWHSSTKEKRKEAHNGCFSVYVGAEKQRFVIKIEFANHPLFKMLLEAAELEYGFNNEGPLLLPCDVDLFCKILAEMDCGGKEFDDQYVCGFGYGYGYFSPFSPARRLGKSEMAKGCTSYCLLTPPRLLKINHF